MSDFGQAKMDVIESLKADGWQLSEAGWKRITENGGLTSKKEVERKALDIDLRELGGCAFPPDVLKDRESLSGNYIVQLQKVANISAPKSNEESKAAPRLLKILVTDGMQVVHAVEMSTIPDLSLDSYPGTKLRFQGEIALSHGVLQLFDYNIEVLGGNVTNMVEKWLIKRKLAKHTRGCIGLEGGPPPWIPFGERIPSGYLEKPEKVEKPPQEGSEEEKDDEFESQRRDAIAEAGKTTVKKIFGGGTKPLLDKNVQAIMDEGFTRQQAEGALKQSKNNFKKALKNLQRKSGVKPENKEKVELEKKNRRKGEDEVTPKPSGKVSLFSFVEDKLPFQQGLSSSELYSAASSYLSENQKTWENPRPYQERPKPGPGHGRGASNGRTNPPNNLNRNPQDRRQREERRPMMPQNFQKAPRFQNQARQNDFSSMNFGMTKSDSPDNLMPKKSTTKYETFNSFSNSSLEYKSQNSSNFFKPPGIPNIPEFPYKDNSFMSPLMSSNLGYFDNSNKQSSNKGPDKWIWKVGDMCMAKYWEDDMYYNAEITGLSNKTCVVRFLDYGNYEEVLRDDCIPLEEPDKFGDFDNKPMKHQSSGRGGFPEFHRGGGGGGRSGTGNRRNGPRTSGQMFGPPPSRNNKEGK